MAVTARQFYRGFICSRRRDELMTYCILKLNYQDSITRKSSRIFIRPFQGRGVADILTIIYDVFDIFSLNKHIVLIPGSDPK